MEAFHGPATIACFEAAGPSMASVNTAGEAPNRYSRRCGPFQIPIPTPLSSKAERLRKMGAKKRKSFQTTRISGSPYVARRRAPAHQCDKPRGMLPKNFPATPGKAARDKVAAV